MCCVAASGGPAGGASLPVPALVPLPWRARLQESLSQPPGSGPQLAEGVRRGTHRRPLPVSPVFVHLIISTLYAGIGRKCFTWEPRWMDGQDHWLVLTSNLIYSINQGCTDTRVQYSTRIRKICAITMTQIPVYMYVYDSFGGGSFTSDWVRQRLLLSRPGQLKLGVLLTSQILFGVEK